MTSNAEGAPGDGAGVEERKPAPSTSASAPSTYLSSVALGWMRWIALGAVVISIFARAIAPGLQGFAVGWDRFTNRAEVASEILTQLAGVWMLVVAFVLVTEVARSRAPVYLRVGAIVLTGIECLVVFASLSAERAPSFLFVASCCAASILAIAAGLDALKQPATGSLGIVGVLVGASSLFRGVAVVLADRAALLPRSDGVDSSRVVATAAFVLQIAALVIAVAWLTSRAKKVVSPGVVVALGIAAFVTRQVSIESNDPGPMYFLIKHGAERLLSRPVPFVPPVVELFVAIVAPLLAIAALAQRRQVPALLGGLALLLITGTTAEVPLQGIGLVVASLAVTLASRDARGVWAAIAAQERSKS